MPRVRLHWALRESRCGLSPSHVLLLTLLLLLPPLLMMLMLMPMLMLMLLLLFLSPGDRWLSVQPQ